MFLSIEVTRWIERERRREAERRIPLLVAIREQSRPKERPTSQRSGFFRSTGPRSHRQTGPGY
jgi:hypothetical protein